MSEIPVCTIVMSSQISASEIASLEMALEINEIKLQKSTERIVGADDVVFIATVMGGLAATANLVEYGIKVSKAINNWRKSRRDRGETTPVRLEHPQRPPLDLDTATDEEVDEWFGADEVE